MIIESASGTRYLYDMRSNKILPEEEAFLLSEARPIVFGCIEEADSLPNIDTFILELTQSCNFRCSYCCYGGAYSDNRSHSSKHMDEKTLLQSIKFIAKHRVVERPLNIAFYGGEPLLQFDRIKLFIDKAKSVLPQNIKYTISTNGSLLANENILSWCILNDITLNISYDGDQSIYGSERRFVNGQNSREHVYSVLENLFHAHRDYWIVNVNLLVSVKNPESLMSIAKEWAESPILRGKAPYLISGVSPAVLSDLDLDEQKILTTLRAFLDFYACNRDNLFAKAYFEMLCSPILDRQIFELPDGYTPRTCLPFNPRCYIDSDGNLGICEKTSDKLRLGNVYEGWNMSKVNEAVIKMAERRIATCSGCEMFRLCKTCFTNYYYDKEWIKADCRWQCTWNRIALAITIDLLERDIDTSELLTKYSLRPIEEQDVASILRIMSKESVMKYVEGVEKLKNLEDSFAFFLLVSEINANFALPSLLAIVDEESELIGVVGVDDISDGVANLFFILDDDYWGKGIMTAMLSMYLAMYAPIEAKQITARINKRNSAALALMKNFSRVTVSTDPLL